MPRTMSPQSAPNGVYVLADIPNYGAVLAAGLVVPSSVPGYAIGCLFSHLNGTDGSALYVNEGTADSCTFNLIVVT